MTGMQILVIYDTDWGYARQLADYIGGKKEYLVHSFNQEEKLLAFAKENVIDVLLLGATLLDQAVESMQVQNIVLLSDGDRFREGAEYGKTGYSAVYKYQAAEQIVRTIKNVSRIQDENWIGAQGSTLIAVYSPVKRCGKTSFAIGLTKHLAEEKNALYLNLEIFSGLNEMMGQSEYDVGDFLFYFRQGEMAFLRMMNQLITHGKELDYVMPARYGGDIRDSHAKEWLDAIALIGNKGMYDVVVIDIGELAGDSWELLQQCSTVYVPRLADVLSEKKVKEWEQYLFATGRPEILERCIYVDVPVAGCLGESAFSITDLSWEKVSRYLNSDMSRS